MSDNPHSTVDLIAKLRDALKHADRELQRRCVISGQVREAMAAADGFLNECRLRSPA